MQRSAVWWFAILLLATVPAFWPSYFAAPAFKADFLHVHFHGLVMFAWMVLLVAQAALIRTGRRALHRALGKVSFALVPVILVSTLLLAHYRVRQGPPSAETLYFLYVQLSLIAIFVIAYALAMARRRDPPLHMRYVVVSTLALVDPILARLLFNHFRVEPPLLQLLTYGFVMAILAALWWRDRGTRFARPYSTMLALFAVAVAPTFFITDTETWRLLAVAYGKLPLP